MVNWDSFIACKENFVTKNIEARWTEIYIPKKDLYVLGVYVPVSGGAEKNLFWKKILDYSKENADNNVMIMGDFNSCTRDDSANQTDYNPKDLIKLEELGYIDLWKHNTAQATAPHGADKAQARPAGK